METYQIIDHTGEIGVLAHGTTLAQAFGEAATGMFSFMVDLESVDLREARQVELEATDVGALLVAWLNELIYIFDVEGLVFREFQVEETVGPRLKAVCRGERLDPQRHKFSIGPKAATYHMLEVVQEAGSGGRRARVILDI